MAQGQVPQTTAATDNAALLARFDRLPSWAYPWSVLAIVGLGFFFGTYNTTSVGYVVPKFEEQYHLAASAGSLVITANFIGFPVGAYLLSIVADYLGRRWAFICATLVYTAGTIASAVAFSVVWLAVWQFVVGAGIAAVTILQAIIISELAPAHTRGKHTGYATAIGFLAFFVLPLLALALVPTFAYGWRVLYVIGGIAGLLLARWAYKALPETPRWLITKGRTAEAEREVGKAEARLSSRGVLLPQPRPALPERPVSQFPTLALFRRPYLGRLAIALAAWFVFYIGNHGWTSLAPTLLLAKGYTLQKSLLFLVVTNVAYPVGTYVAAVLSDRAQRKWTACAGMFLWAVSFMFIAVAPSPVTIMVAGAAGTFFMAGVLPLFYVLTAESFPTRARSNGLGITDGIGHVGAAVAPALIIGVGSALAAFEGGIMVIVIAAAVTGVMMLFMIRATGKPLQEVSQ